MNLSLDKRLLLLSKWALTFCSTKVDSETVALKKLEFKREAPRKQIQREEREAKRKIRQAEPESVKLKLIVRLKLNKLKLIIKLRLMKGRGKEGMNWL